MRDFRKNFSNLIFCMLVLALSLFLLCGCVDDSEKNIEDCVYVYYVGVDGLSIGKELVEYDFTGDPQDISEMFDALRREPKSTSLKRTLDLDAVLLSHELQDRVLNLDFNSQYHEIPKSEELLFRAAIVKSFCQLEQIDGVLISVEGSPLLDSSQNPIGVMDGAMFIQNLSGEGDYEKCEIKLYFASLTGDGLTAVKKEAMRPVSETMAQFVVKELIKGPGNELLLGTISRKRRLNFVTVQEGVCYVDFAEIEGDTTGAVPEELSVYSVVNSLSELEDISKVKITIDGEDNRTFRGGISLKQTFERNLDLLK